MYVVDRADPAWLIAVQQRTATLWIGPQFARTVTAASLDLSGVLRDLVLRPWAAVVVDAADLPIEELEDERFGSLLVRMLDELPQGNVPTNRLPVFLLRGRAGTGQTAGAKSLLKRFSLLQAAPLHHEVFAVGINTPDGIAGLSQAAELRPSMGFWILCDESSIEAVPVEDHAEAVFHWPIGVSGLQRFVHDIVEERPQHQIAVRGGPIITAVDVSAAVDPSLPITHAFELLPAEYAIGKWEPSLDALRSLLTDPTASWLPYAAGVPVQRHLPYHRSLERALREVHREGPQSSLTAWIPAEEAAGSTTVLRMLCLDAARLGYPVLVGRPGVLQFNFKQLSHFLTHATQRLEAEAPGSASLPWLIAFDAEHVQNQWDFVSGVANGLRNLHRPVIILGVRPESQVFAGRDRAHGTNRVLGDVLTNTVSFDEAVRVGEHLSGMLPAGRRKSADQWRSFAAEAVRTSAGSRSSLFWLALRFWLFLLPGANESLRNWIGRKLQQASDGNPAFDRAILEVAAMSRYRLPLPSDLIPVDGLRALQPLLRDSTNPFGLGRIDLGWRDALSVAHPAIAEEILSIAAGSESMLRAVGKDLVLGMKDFELHLLGRILKRPEAGSAEALPIIEELVTSGLRVDPHSAPQNFAVRQEIVELLQDAPDSVWDHSQVFNHHLAKARRHLAVDPPDSRDWTLEARIEQLELAENHLRDALENIFPEDEDRRESPLNLHVSLALTLDQRARLEAERDDLDTSARFREAADQEYELARRYSPDNTYVLENYARFKIKRASEEVHEESRNKLLVDAITMLQWELDGGEGQYRAEPVYEALADAYDLLEERSGRSRLRLLAEEGSEAAATALASLILRGPDESITADDLAEAEAILRAIPYSDTTWRSTSALYRVISKRTPNDFPARLEVIRRLDEPTFSWPLQLLVEYGILLFQVGNTRDRHRGSEVYQQVRDLLVERRGALRVPSEMRFLMNPVEEYRSPLRTYVKVKEASGGTRTIFVVPQGWYNVDIVLRPHRFPQVLRPSDEVDCYIQFTNFGPEAIPTTVDLSEV